MTCFQILRKTRSDRQYRQRQKQVLTIVARCRRGRGGVSVVAAANLEDYLHVVAGAPSTDTLVQIVLRRGADEVVIASWKELWTSGLRCERPEGDSEVQRLVGIVADRYAPRSRIRYPTCFVLLLGDLKGKVQGTVKKLPTRIDRQRFRFVTNGSPFFRVCLFLAVFSGAVPAKNINRRSTTVKKLLSELFVFYNRGNGLPLRDTIKRR